MVGTSILFRILKFPLTVTQIGSVTHKSRVGSVTQSKLEIAAEPRLVHDHLWDDQWSAPQFDFDLHTVGVDPTYCGLNNCHSSPK